MSAPGSVKISVLASSSAGNCTAMVVGEGEAASIVLIDAGLSPRATRRALLGLGLSDKRLAAVVLTHLDHDHFNSGWLGYLRRGVPIWVHRRHAGRAERDGLFFRKSEVFTDEFEPVAGVRAAAALLSHDSLGVAVFRFEVRATGRTLGYATDVGTPSRDLVEHLAGVDALAIESNYCPRLQAASGRPEFLKQRITGGSGHLSNQQSAEAVARIAPRGRVVLLHLSRQCNTPELAAAAHASHGRPVTISKPDGPTEWMTISAPGDRCEPRAARTPAPRSLFEATV